MRLFTTVLFCAGLLLAPSAPAWAVSHHHEKSHSGERAHPRAETPPADSKPDAKDDAAAPAVDVVIGYDRADGHHVLSYKRTKADGTTADNLDKPAPKREKTAKHDN